MGEENTALKLPVVQDFFDTRPTTRADCLSGGINEARPCPYVSCRYHLYLDLSEAGTLRINFPTVEPEDMGQLAETCALDVAARGGVTLEEVGQLMNVTRERIRQLEAAGIRRMRRPVALITE